MSSASSAQELFGLAVAREFAGDESGAIEHYTAARAAAPTDLLSYEISSILDDLAPAVAAPSPQTPSRARYWYAGLALMLLIAIAAVVLVRQRAAVPSHPPRASAKDTVLPAPAPAGAASPQSGQIGAASPAPPRSPGGSPTREQGAAAAPPMPPPATVVGTWTFSEQVRDETNGIDCKSTGTLDLQLNEGLLDGTVSGKETCQAEGKTETLDTKAQLEAGRAATGSLAFTTRITRDGLTTSCRYSGQVLGDTGRAMAGDVTCEARFAGDNKALSLAGTWRATRK